MLRSFGGMLHIGMCPETAINMYLACCWELLKETSKELILPATDFALNKTKHGFSVLTVN